MGLFRMLRSRSVNTLHSVEILCTDQLGMQRRKGPRPALVAPVVTAVKSISTTSSMTQKRNGLAPNSPKASDENVPRCKVNNQQESKPDMDSQQPKNGSKRAIVKTPAIKREQSDFFKSMSKPKTKLDRENTDSSTGASPAPTIVFSVSLVLVSLLDRQLRKPGRRMQAPMRTVGNIFPYTALGTNAIRNNERRLGR